MIGLGENALRLEISAFIDENRDWEQKLTDSPYFVRTKRGGGFILLKYDQNKSDFSLPLVRECRGLILDETDDYRPVCVPFFKFGNFGERYIPKIDWASARAQEKMDGSLIKLWYYKGTWNVSSNSEIDARNAHLHSALFTRAARTDLYSLFMESWSKTGLSMDSLDKAFTYMFELTSPHNRVVVRYGETSIWHIGTRDNRTLLECDPDIGVAKPRSFQFNTLDACIESATQLGDNDEGYVVVDRNFNRIKVKSPRYVALNHMSQGVTTRSNVVAIIQKNEQAEFLTYFPEFQAVFDDILYRIDAFSEQQSATLTEIKSSSYGSRKDLAAAVVKTECPACIFTLIDGKATTPRDWLLSLPTASVLRAIGADHKQQA